jgi:phenylalanyl-tRNA synthetase alpha chain
MATEKPVNAAEITAALTADLESARGAVSDATTAGELDDVRRRFTGKKSVAAAVKEAIKNLEPAERPVIGKAVSEHTAAIEALIVDAVASAGRNVTTGKTIDPTLGGHVRSRGHLHLVTQVQRELEDIFVGMGYRVAEGPEVEDDWHNFEALNIPPAHPARSMQDTLYVQLGAPEQVMLRTHTSPVQIRTMETNAPPIYVVAPGRTYRNETLDARHSPVFHQMECLAVDRGLTMADLFGTIEAFVRALFADASLRTRFRPDFFPYTEPSAELAVSCPFCGGSGCRVCSHTGWIELGGCGMVDPNVLAGVGIDPEVFTGFAFGFGLERIAMVRYGIDEIKTFFENDVRFLVQY